MPLPPPESINTLFGFLRPYSNSTTFGPFNEVRDKLIKIAKMAGMAGVQSGLQMGITSAVATAGVASGVSLAVTSFATIGSAIGPWLSAAAVYKKADGIFALHDLKDFASGRRKGIYTCSCGKCAAGLEYVINKKENNVVIIALAPFTGGLTAIVDRINSVRKSLQKNRPKEMHSRQFVESARDSCVSAMAAIMLLCGKWPDDKPPDENLLIEAVTILLADDGWAHLKSKW
nr:hypothetical protein [uncultured Roseococcus sp.]